MLASVVAPVRSIATAARRPQTMPAQLREAASTAVTAAMWPFGLADRGIAELQRVLGTGSTGSTATPVLLVHGYGANKSNWLFLRRYLRDAGFDRVDALNYNPLTADIVELGERCAGRASDLMAACETARIHLIGHSLGGVVARQAVQIAGLVGVATCITVGSPHGGAPLARLGMGRTARQLRPGSSVLRRLADQASPTDTRFVAYYSNLDLVVPGHRARIDAPALAATNHLLKDEGHLSMLLSRRLATSIIAEIRSAEEISTPTLAA